VSFSDLSRLRLVWLLDSLKRGSRYRMNSKRSLLVRVYNRNIYKIGKEQLEELRNLKKVKEPMLTPEERASKVNKQEIKGTGFNLEMYCSEKGRVMIEN